MQNGEAAEQLNVGMLKKVGGAGKWAGLRQLSVRLFTVLQVLIIAQYLTPAQLGAFSVAQTIYGFIEAITFFGLSQSLIQKHTISDIELNTAFVANILRGLCLFIIIGGIAYPVSHFMNSPMSSPLIFAIGLMPILVGLQNPGMVFFQKNLDYKKDFNFYLYGASANFVVATSAIFMGLGAWALIFGLLAQGLVQILMSYRISPYRPKIQFSRESFDELFDFSKWLLVAQGLKYFSNNLPLWVLGYFSGAHAMGIYNMAARFSQAIGGELAALISNVAFPTFSRFILDQDKLKRVYVRSQKVISATSFYIFGSIISFSDPFVKLLLGEKWLDSRILIVILCLVGLVQSMGAQAEILKATNRPSVIAKFSVIRLFLSGALIVPLYLRLGVMGAVLAILIPTLILFAPVMSIILRALQVTPVTLFKVFLPGALSAATLVGVNLILVNQYVTDIAIFVLAALVHSFVFVILFGIFDRIIGTEIVSEFKGLVNASFGRGRS